MRLTVECPTCSARSDFDGEPGQPVTCPQCRELMALPNPAAVAPPRQSHCLACGGRINNRVTCADCETDFCSEDCCRRHQKRCTVKAAAQSRSGMIVAAAFGVVMAVAIAAALISDGCSGRTKRTTLSTPIVVDAADLCGRTLTDKAAVEREFKGRLVELSGVVGGVGKNSLDGPFCILAMSDKRFTVDLWFRADQEAIVLAMKPGQPVHVRGRVAKFVTDPDRSGAAVQIEDAVIVP